jgi:hypothetical protein
MIRRSCRPPLSDAHRAKLSASATAQHARARGYELPPEKREAYMRLQRSRVPADVIRERLGLGELEPA